MPQDDTHYEDELGPVRDDDPAPASARHSLIDDAQALYEDTKTYVEAEVAYQKSRAGFLSNRIKWISLYGAVAFGFFHLALIAFTVGVVIALTPLVGPWLATAIVVMALLMGGVLLLLKIRGKIQDIRDAFEDGAS